MEKNELDRNSVIGKIRFSEFSMIRKDLEVIPYAIIKGEALSVLVYGKEARRISNDIDVLVSRDNISMFENILKKNGYQTKQSNLNRYNRILSLTGSHQIGSYYKKVMGIDIIFDINFDIYWGEYKGKKISVEEMLEDVIEIDIYGQTVHTLSPCFSCIQLVLHHYKEFNSMYHLVKGNAITSKKLRDIKDFFERYCEVDCFIEELIFKVHFYELEAYFFYMLYYVKKVFPDTVGIDELIEEFRCDSGIQYLDVFGLADSERKQWNIDFSERLDYAGLSEVVKKRLTTEDKKKLEREVEIFG